MWAFWLQVIGMLGMTMAFAAAGIVQTYLEHILGMGYLDTQHKLAVHFIMLIATGSLFALGVLFFLIDFFFIMVRAPRTAGIAGARGPVIPLSPQGAEGGE
jgi:nitric oxide reductase subunit B